MIRLLGILPWLRPVEASPVAATPPATTPAATTSRYAAANTRIRDTAKWMAAALAAVATVLVGTSPLSGIGRLSAEEPGRLACAVAAIVIGLGAALIAILLLSRIQLPQTVLAADVAAMAENDRSAVAHEAVHEPFLRAGRPNLKAMMKDYTQVQADYYAAVEELVEAQRAALGARSTKEREAAAARVAAARACLSFEEDRDRHLAPAVRYVTDLAVHEKLRERARTYLPWIVGLSVLAGSAFVMFAWAANPPEASAGDTAVPARPSAGVLLGDPDDEQALARQLGAECARQIVDGGGTAVLALSASEGEVEVAIVPDAVCSSSARLTVAADRVVPADEVGTG